MPNQGTLESKFSKNYLYLNPNVIYGPYTWNVSNHPVESTDSQVFGVPPIKVVQVELDVDLSYSIIDLLGIDESGNEFMRVSDASSISQKALTNIDVIEGIRPVIVSRTEYDAVLLFSIISMESVASIANTTSALNASSGYNGKSIDSLTTSLPLEAFEAGGTATVSFAIILLPDA